MKGGDTMENEKDVASEVATAEPENATAASDETAECTGATEESPLAYRKRKRRLGDRREGRRLRTIQPVLQLMPYVMPKRCDALNTFYDRLEVSRVDDLCRRKVRDGKVHFSALHVLLAAYLRTISQRPGINRFVSGQKIFARNEIVFVMTVKKELALNAPETLIKVKFNPADTLDEVYEKFNATAQAAIASMDHPTEFDNLCRGLSRLPGLLLRFIMWILRVLDYIGHLPKAFLDVSPFHGSMIITSMGSLGIKPIYHHIYDFGNLPVFISYGTKSVCYEYDRKGVLNRRKYMDIKVVTDERICDGHYYASAFKYYKKLIEHPDLLESRPDKIVEDID